MSVTQQARNTATNGPSSTGAPPADPLATSALADPLTASKPQQKVGGKLNIMDVASMKDGNLAQDKSLNNADAAMKAGREAHQALAGSIQTAAKAANARAEIPDAKSLERAAEKVTKDFGGDWTKITDIARGSIVCTSVEALGTAYEVLSGMVKIKQVKNRFKEPKDNGYRDMNLVVQVPGLGVLGEVQLHVDQIQQVKSGPEHKVYEEKQAIERKAKTEKRALTPEEAEKMNRLTAESKELYDAAWKKAQGGGEDQGKAPEAPGSSPADTADGDQQKPGR